MLVEPLPALLSCVYQLTSKARQVPAAADPTRGPGSLGGSENWMGMDDGNADQQDQSTTGALKVRKD